MSKIKSYTTLEQSKKLAEILPIESADMEFMFLKTDGTMVSNVPFLKEETDEPDCSYKLVPCWSLAALLDILPPYLFEFERGIDLNVYPNLNGRGWHCSYIPNCIENMKTDKFKLITSGDILVDACYEMIIKLNEQKFL